jgi:hypothetical protein
MTAIDPLETDMRRLHARNILGLLVVWVAFLATPGFAQTAASHAPPNTPNTKRIEGTVTRVDGNELLLKVKGGTTETYQLAPAVRLGLARPALMSDLSSGKSVSCTSIYSEGTKVLAGECRILPDGMHEFTQAHDTPDTSITPTISGTITDVRDDAEGGKGRRILIQISYPAGQTTMTVSSLTAISVVTAANASSLKPGAKVRGLSQQAADGTGVLQMLMILSPDRDNHG